MEANFAHSRTRVELFYKSDLTHRWLLPFFHSSSLFIHELVSREVSVISFRKMIHILNSSVNGALKTRRLGFHTPFYLKAALKVWATLIISSSPVLDSHKTRGGLVIFYVPPWLFWNSVDTTFCLLLNFLAEMNCWTFLHRGLSTQVSLTLNERSAD